MTFSTHHQRHLRPSPTDRRCRRDSWGVIQSREVRENALKGNINLMWHHFNTDTQLQLTPWFNLSSSQYLLGILGYEIVMRSGSLSHTLIHWDAPLYSRHSSALQPTFPRPCHPPQPPAHCCRPGLKCHKGRAVEMVHQCLTPGDVTMHSSVRIPNTYGLSSFILWSAKTLKCVFHICHVIKEQCPNCQIDVDWEHESLRIF